MQERVIEGCRVSPQQKPLWSLQQPDGRFAYSVRIVALIEGSLEIERFEKSFEQVVDRQEILRTTFQCLPGMTIPVQVIGERIVLKIDHSDFSGLRPNEQSYSLELLSDRLTTDS